MRDSVPENIYNFIQKPQVVPLRRTIHCNFIFKLIRNSSGVYVFGIVGLEVKTKI